MAFTLLLALSGVALSAVAIYYSVLGLAAIFAAAAGPVIVMGVTLEVTKLVAASWVKANWSRIPVLMRWYMTSSVVILMLITSMGIFGFLSAAHSEQALPVGEVAAQISIIDQKIDYQKQTITANQAVISQLDDAVNQALARTNDVKGVNRAAQLRKQQSADRSRLVAEINAAQKEVQLLTQEKVPLDSSIRQLEAEVGPIKYIAKLVYGGVADAELLDKAVTLVIVILIVVFDPLAIFMLLAAQMNYKWVREDKLAQPAPVPLTEPIEEPEPIEQPVDTEDPEEVIESQEPVLQEDPVAEELSLVPVDKEESAAAEEPPVPLPNVIQILDPVAVEYVQNVEQTDSSLWQKIKELKNEQSSKSNNPT